MVTRHDLGGNLQQLVCGGQRACRGKAAEIRQIHRTSARPHAQSGQRVLDSAPCRLHRSSIRTSPASPRDKCKPKRNSRTDPNPRERGQSHGENPSRLVLYPRRALPQSRRDDFQRRIRKALPGGRCCRNRRPLHVHHPLPPAHRSQEASVPIHIGGRRVLKYDART